jgi:hypothetical protein
MMSGKSGESAANQLMGNLPISGGPDQPARQVGRQKR